DVAVTLRTSTSGSPVDTRYPQSSWNIDKLDGTGISGVTLDSSKQNLYVCDFVWQGTGRIRFGIMNGGTITYFHEILNSNTLTGPWMRSPSRPGRVEMTNTAATAGVNHMDLVCFTAIKESTNDIFVPYTFSASPGRTGLVVGATLIPVISLRPNTTFNGITNRVVIQPTAASVATGNVATVVQIILNPTTLTGASFSAPNSFSAAQVDVAATAVSGGTILWEEIIQPSGFDDIDLAQLGDVIALGLDIAGTTPDVVTVAVQSTAGNTTTFAGLTWQEYQ